MLEVFHTKFNCFEKFRQSFQDSLVVQHLQEFVVDQLFNTWPTVVPCGLGMFSFPTAILKKHHL